MKKKWFLRRPIILGALIVCGAIVATTIIIYNANRDTTSIPNGSEHRSSPSQPVSSDVSDAPPRAKPAASTEHQNTKLLIKEWGVSVLLSPEMQGSVTYILSDITPDPDGNKLQSAKIFVKSSALSGNECSPINTSLGVSVEVGTQYIRSEASKPFNASRYRWTLNENILTTNEYNYHLNYLVPDCMRSAAARLGQLQEALLKLEEPA
jgi:hypothetical protein